MLKRERILELFEHLNSKLQASNSRGEIGIVGGAVMCVVFKARESTKDVDAIFEPSAMIRQFATEIADEEELDPSWLNDGAKGYLTSGFQKQEVLRLSNLNVWAPEPKYMLAMKCLSARFDSEDRNDVVFLIKHLKIKAPKDVFDILAHYYPSNRIPAKTTFFVEELFEEKMT